jgi:hypothetical protein
VDTRSTVDNREKFGSFRHTVWNIQYGTCKCQKNLRFQFSYKNITDLESIRFKNGAREQTLIKEAQYGQKKFLQKKSAILHTFDDIGFFGIMGNEVKFSFKIFKYFYSFNFTMSFIIGSNEVN